MKNHSTIGAARHSVQAARRLPSTVDAYESDGTQCDEAVDSHCLPGRRWQAFLSPEESSRIAPNCAGSRLFSFLSAFRSADWRGVAHSTMTGRIPGCGRLIATEAMGHVVAFGRVEQAHPRATEDAVGTGAVQVNPQIGTLPNKYDGHVHSWKYSHGYLICRICGNVISGGLV